MSDKKPDLRNARRLALHIERIKTAERLFDTIDALILRSKECRCKRNKYRCVECSRLMDDLQSIVQAGKFTGHDSRFDRVPPSPEEPKCPDPEPTVATLIRGK